MGITLLLVLLSLYTRSFCFAMPGFSFSDPSVWEAAENFQNDAPLERTYAPPKKVQPKKPTRKERMSELELFNQLNNFKSAKPKKAQNKKQDAGLNKKQESQNKKQDATSKKQESQAKKQDVPPSKPKQSQSKNGETRPKDSNPVQQKTGNQKLQPQPRSQPPKITKALNYPGLIYLKWADFESHVARLGYKQLRNKTTLMDVTLPVEGQTLKAHKKILSSCSPLLKDLLKTADSKSILNLKNTTYADLSAILEFMYAGEVYVEERQLASVLRTAEKLQVKGMVSPNEE